MVGDAVDVYVALLGIQMPDRNQGRVFNADETDARGVSATHGFVPGKKSKQAVDQTPEVTVRTVNQYLRPRNRQRRFFANLAGRRAWRFLLQIFFLHTHVSAYPDLP